MNATALKKPVVKTNLAARNAGQVLKSQGVLKAYLIGITLAVIALLGAMHVDRLTAVVDQPIKAFSVTAEFNSLSQESLREVLEPWVGQSLLSVDIHDIQAGIEELPWVKNATVSRIWPDQIAVQVTEQQAVANWGHKAYLNAEGEIFEPVLVEREAGRPLLIGPEKASQTLRVEMLATMESISAFLDTKDMQAQQLILNERGSWQLGLRSGLFIELGTEPEGARLQRAVKVYSGLDPEARVAVERIDARYTNGVAIRWKDLAVASGYEYVSNPLQR